MQNISHESGGNNINCIASNSTWPRSFWRMDLLMFTCCKCIGARWKSHYFIMPQPNRDKLSRLQLYFTRRYFLSYNAARLYEWGWIFLLLCLVDYGQQFTIFATLSLMMNHVIRFFITEPMSLNWGFCSSLSDSPWCPPRNRTHDYSLHNVNWMIAE